MPGPLKKCWATTVILGLYLRRFLNLAALDARSANADALGGAIYHCANGLEIDVPPALRYVVRVADPVAELRPTPADITYFRHSPHAPLGGNLSLAASGSRSQAI